MLLTPVSFVQRANTSSAGWYVLLHARTVTTTTTMPSMLHTPLTRLMRGSSLTPKRLSTAAWSTNARVIRNTFHARGAVPLHSATMPRMKRAPTVAAVAPSATQPAVTFQAVRKDSGRRRNVGARMSVVSA